jgi:hypothetical protein
MKTKPLLLDHAEIMPVFIVVIMIVVAMLVVVSVMAAVPAAVTLRNQDASAKTHDGADAEGAINPESR